MVLSADPPFDFYELHGFMMWTAWGVLGWVQLFTNRYLKWGNMWRYTMWIHRVSGTLTLLLTWVFAMLALKRAGWEVEVGVHQILGVIVLSFVTLIVLGGVFNRSMMQRLRWRTADMLRIKRGHRWFAYLMLLLTEASIISGSLKYAAYQGDTVNVPGLVHSFVFFISIILIEGLYQKFNRQEMSFVDPHNLVTREDFARRIEGGEELVILDDLILDVSAFKSGHPGGRFLIEHNIGRDVSKFFYGGYTLE